MPRAFVLLAFLFLALLPGIAALAAAPAPVATCPFQYDSSNDEIRVMVMINGKGPFSMKLDTGSTMSLITPEVATAAGVESLARTRTCGAYGADVSLGSGMIDEVRVGNVALYAQQCFIGSLNNATPCDGILSGQIFDQYAVQLNFTSDTMSLYTNGTYHPSAGDTCVPIHIEANHVPVCDGTVDDMPVTLEVDSGFDGWLTLFPDFVQENHLPDKYRKVRTVTTYSLEGVRDVGLYAIKDLDIGSGASERRLENVFGLFDDFDSSDVSYNYDGLLGTQFLAHGTVTFDYAHSRLVFH